eukprot:scaffold10476_cov142-Cylindrotheca_fusiformis.AAC.7
MFFPCLDVCVRRKLFVVPIRIFISVESLAASLPRAFPYRRKKYGVRVEDTTATSTTDFYCFYGTSTCKPGRMGSIDLRFVGLPHSFISLPQNKSAISHSSISSFEPLTAATKFHGC